ncbi:MAG TPA: UDP-N-acetylmuramate dehydrogenase [Firmicutes bacterium]|nr:UDP-N-acetylmuramate dehydrogenase [Bacillota bacterium]
MSRMFLSSLLSAGVGGEAETTIVTDASAFSYREGDIVLGAGTNVIASDIGVRERVIVMRNTGVEIVGRYVTAESGTPLSLVARKACEAGLGGLEWATGIPGSAGGAVATNAGAFGGETGRLVRSVCVMTERGERIVTAGSLDFSYRSVRGLPRGAITRVVFGLKESDPKTLFARAEECAAKRRATQPTGRSAGSTFLACDGVGAGYYIDRAGLKGFRAGGARVSEKHANFIITERGATASDWRKVADTVKLAVYSAFGVRLKEEVRYIGEF